MNIHLIERSSSRSHIAALQQGALPCDKLIIESAFLALAFRALIEQTRLSMIVFY
jgi:hypothetical protein